MQGRFDIYRGYIIPGIKVNWILSCNEYGNARQIYINMGIYYNVQVRFRYHQVLKMAMQGSFDQKCLHCRSTVFGANRNEKLDEK